MSDTKIEEVLGRLKIFPGDSTWFLIFVRL